MACPKSNDMTNNIYTQVVTLNHKLRNRNEKILERHGMF